MMTMGAVCFRGLLPSRHKRGTTCFLARTKSGSTWWLTQVKSAGTQWPTHIVKGEGGARDKVPASSTVTSAAATGSQAAEAETANLPELSFSSLAARDRERKRAEQKPSSSASVASKRGRTDSVSPASSRTSSKRPTLVSHLREESQTWQQKYTQRDEQLARLNERHYDLQKELQKKQAEWESSRVHLSQQLQAQTARGDKHRDEAEKYRGERNEAREERDAISRDLATLREEQSRPR